MRSCVKKITIDYQTLIQKQKLQLYIFINWIMNTENRY